MTSIRFGLTTQSPDSELQKRFPGNYAHLVNPAPLGHVVPNTLKSIQTLNQARTHTPAKDADLANLDDNLKRGGSLLIATLATLGLKQRIFGVGEFLGFLSWFGAMALTPRIINAFVRVKTGLNLNQQYNSTYGQRRNLFQDPGHQPLHLLSEATINRVGNRLGVPKNAPNRRQLVEEKIRQVSVQANTWWMLVAGPATPVISGMVCDYLQDPVMRGVNRIKQWRAEAAVKFALRSADRHPEKLAAKTQAYLNQFIGEAPESSLSTWWKQFGRDMTRHSRLDTTLSITDVLDHGLNINKEGLINTVADHLGKLQQQHSALNGVLKYLDAQREKITQMQHHANSFIETHKEHLPKAVLRDQRRLVEERSINALSTIAHYDNLFSAIRQGASHTQIRSLMESPILAEVLRLNVLGEKSQARKLAGGPDVFAKLEKALGNRMRQDQRAFTLMGASPQNHLLTSLKDVMSHKLWQRRMLRGLGGGMLLATLLYTAVFVGRDFGKKQRPGGQG